MIKILAVCGNGLGSSFMVELNIKSIISELGIKDVEVDHGDLTSLTADAADILVVAKDLDSQTKFFKGKKIVLINIIDKTELKNKLVEILK